MKVPKHFIKSNAGFMNPETYLDGICMTLTVLYVKSESTGFDIKQRHMAKVDIEMLLALVEGIDPIDGAGPLTDNYA